MIGRMLSHYRIVSKLGAGGMGEIYRAKDLELEREPRMQYLRLYGPGTALAEAAILEGRNEEALAALEQVVDTGWLVNWRWEIEHNPIFDAVREEPAYRRIVKKLENNTRRERERWSRNEPGS